MESPAVRWSNRNGEFFGFVVRTFGDSAEVVVHDPFESEGERAVVPVADLSRWNLTASR